MMKQPSLTYSIFPQFAEAYFTPCINDTSLNDHTLVSIIDLLFVFFLTHILI